MKISSWKTVSSKIVAKNPFIILKESQVRRPSGKILPYYHLKMLDFSVVIPLDKNTFTYLIYQYRYAIGKKSLEFPMGYVPKVSFKKMAQMELLQETGIKAKKIQKLGSFYLGAANSDQKASAFFAQDLSFGKPSREENEFLEVRKIKISEVPEMIKKGDITDGPSISAFLLLSFKLKGLL